MKNKVLLALGFVSFIWLLSPRPVIASVKCDQYKQGCDRSVQDDGSLDQSRDLANNQKLLALDVGSFIGNMINPQSQPQVQQPYYPSEPGTEPYQPVQQPSEGGGSDTRILVIDRNDGGYDPRYQRPSIRRGYYPWGYDPRYQRPSIRGGYYRQYQRPSIRGGYDPRYQRPYTGGRRDERRNPRQNNQNRRNY